MILTRSSIVFAASAFFRRGRRVKFSIPSIGFDKQLILALIAVSKVSSPIVFALKQSKLLSIVFAIRGEKPFRVNSDWS